MAIHCTAAERGGLIKRKKRKKESSSVKLKAFRHAQSRIISDALPLKAIRSSNCSLLQSRSELRGPIMHSGTKFQRNGTLRGGVIVI